MPTARVEPDHLMQQARQAAELLRGGGLVVFPTETVYGIAACADQVEAVRRLAQLKGRRKDEPITFAVHVPDADAALRYAPAADWRIGRLMRRLLPGPVTLVIALSPGQIKQATEDLSLSPAAANHLFGQGVIALRSPDHRLARRMLEEVDCPVLAASANRADQMPPRDAADVRRAVGDDVDLVLDGGRCRYAQPSAVIHLTEALGRVRIDLQRPGVYDKPFIQKLMRYSILFVCSGNTCRSPMAEAITRQMLSQRYGVTMEQLEDQGYRVGSAGVFAVGDAPASGLAVEALGKMGIDLSRHRSRPLTLEMVRESDVIFCMTAAHRRAVLDLAPEAKDKVRILDEASDIEDPIGTDATTYQRTAEMIRRRVAARLAEIEP